ncbi:MAG TPA: YciI family protein [Pyrinomonadaceae bacterium]|nr:YciI family protein [Pyrinomonadaceae bacterium]
MKRTAVSNVLALLVVAMMTLIVGTPFRVSPNVRAQEKQPEHKMIEFHMALLKRGPAYNAAGMARDLQTQHIANVVTMLESGKAVIAGPMGDEGDITGILIFRAKSAEEARAWAENDPAVKAGFFTAEMHPWWSEDVMKKPSSPIKLTTAYLALLTRGAKWTPEKTPATEELQKAHIANIVRLAEMKKLVVAGPFGDGGQLRGIFVFKVASLDEARALAETDPAVKAGRLAMDLHPWLVPEGVLP